MLKLKKMMIDNNITVKVLNEKTKVSNLDIKYLKLIDFKIKDLEAIKAYFVSIGIVNESIDIGEFLDEVE